MAKVFYEIDDHLRDWIARQALFFVGTAPLNSDGHINVSPKGPIGSLAVLGARHVACLDVHGSGAETIAHLRENGRISLMLCAFEGPPRIVRLHGVGRRSSTRIRVIRSCTRQPTSRTPRSPRRGAASSTSKSRESATPRLRRALMSLDGHREHHALTARKRIHTMGPGGYEEFQRERNARSLDGLPALPPRR
jgi:hypothetical protein